MRALKIAPYSDENLQKIYHQLESLIEQQQPLEYSIKVDGMLVVARTKDLAVFTSHQLHVDETTRNVTVTVYHGKSTNGHRHIFTGPGMPAQEQAMALNGLPLAKPGDFEKKLADRVEERMSAAQKEWKIKELEKENTRLRKKLKKAKKYEAELEEGLAMLQEQAQAGQGNFGDTILNTLAGLSRLSPRFAAFSQQQSGLAGSGERVPEEEPVTIRKKKGNTHGHQQQEQQANLNNN